VSDDFKVIELADLGIDVGLPRADGADVPKRGDRRLVKLVPCDPLGGAKPAIWTSPVFATTTEKRAVVCVLLASGSPKPQTVSVTLPKDFYDKLPEVPVEW